MFRFYETTPLEQFVEELYQNKGILHPNQINIEEIAKKLHIWIYYSELDSKAVEIRYGLGSINIYKNQSPKLQLIDFLHELCHLLRHAGDQRYLPELFTKAQEDEASQFVLYASMPFFMISQMEIPVETNEAIQFLSSAFNVPLKFAKNRLEQIQRRLLQGALTTSSVLTEPNSVSMNNYHLDTIETKIYAYYDPNSDQIDPSQFLIHVDKQTLFSQEELLFSLSGPFEIIEDGQLLAFTNSKPVKFNDLDYKNGKISLRLNHLASRYYNSEFKFVIHMREVKEVLKFHGVCC